MISQICQIIKDNIDIVEFCSDYYNCVFVPSSNNWYNTNCLMPDHKDTNPSFGVNSETNTYNCLGCSSKGSVIDLVMKIENYDLRQATDFLLDYLNIQPEVSTKNFYALHKLLTSNSSKGLDKDMLLDAKIKTIKKTKKNNVLETFYLTGKINIFMTFVMSLDCFMSRAEP